MEHAKNRAPMSHEMSTKNQGTILAAERANLLDPVGGLGGRAGRNSFEEPSDIQFGPNGCGSERYGVGGDNPCNHNDADGDFDNSPYPPDYWHQVQDS